MNTFAMLRFLGPITFGGAAVFADDAPGNLPATSAVEVRFRTEPSRVTAGRPAAVVISVLDSSGKPVRNFSVMHEKLIHLIIVSSDLETFEHVHPERGKDGEFQIAHTFPSSGTYWLYAEVTPEGSAARIGKHTVKVEGETKLKDHPAEGLAESLSSSGGGMRVELTGTVGLRTGRESELGLAVSDSITGVAVTDLEPYLGALVHVVVIGVDGTFVHAHAVDLGMSKQAGHNGHHGHTGQQSLDVKVVFPESGWYRLWAQFQRAGRVVTAPFTLRVAP